LIVLAAGPPIGGVVFAFIGSFIIGAWTMLPMATVTAPMVSYLIGVPIVVIALMIFLPLQLFVEHGTLYLAVVCGALAAEIAVLLWDVISGPRSDLGLYDYMMGFVVFGIPSAVSAFACWHITRHLHRLQ
jgi:hypothetical protein